VADSDLDVIALCAKVQSVRRTRCGTKLRHQFDSVCRDSLIRVRPYVIGVEADLR
jgi:hypothetical protein